MPQQPQSRNDEKEKDESPSVDAQRQRQRRANLSPEALKMLREKDAVRARERRANALSEEEKAERRRFEAQRKRERRANLSPESLRLLREKDARRERDRRANNMTEEEKSDRRQLLALKKREQRASTLSEEDKAEERLLPSLRKITQQFSALSEEVKAERRRVDAQRKRERQAKTLSEEEKAERRRLHAQQNRERRANLSPEKLRQYRETQARRERERRANNLTVEDRTERRRLEAQRKRERRANLSFDEIRLLREKHALRQRERRARGAAADERCFDSRKVGRCGESFFAGVNSMLEEQDWKAIVSERDEGLESSSADDSYSTTNDSSIKQEMDIIDFSHFLAPAEKCSYESIFVKEEPLDDYALNAARVCLESRKKTERPSDAGAKRPRTKSVPTSKRNPLYSSKCDACDVPFNSRDLLQLHNIKTHNAEPPYSCVICREIFVNARDEYKHRDVAHRNGRGFFECFACEKETFHFDRFLSHLNKHRKRLDKEEFGNSEVNVASNLIEFRRNELKTNIADSTSEDVIIDLVCICGLEFKRSDSLNIHCNLVHSADGGAMAELLKTKEMKFICDYCGLCFGKRYLQDHIVNKHLGLKPYACPECDRRYAMKSSLRAHRLSRHAKHRKFKCADCDKEYFTPAGLGAHVCVAHSDAKPFPCIACPKRFVNRHALRSHETEHALLREFECGFSKVSALGEHLMTHRDVSAFSCDMCSRGFRRKRNVLRHFEEKHPEIIGANLIKIRKL